MSQPAKDKDRRKRADEKTVLKVVDNVTPVLYSEPAEKALLAAILLQPDLFPLIAEQLQPSDFWTLWHGFIWWAMGELDREGTPIDMVSIDETLKHSPHAEYADMLRLAQLTETPFHASAIEGYCSIIRDFARRRRVLLAADEIRRTALDTTKSVDEVVEVSTTTLFQATEQRGLLDDTHISVGGKQLWDDIDARYERGVKAGVSTGFVNLDARLDGLMPGELTVIAGSSGMGKTTFMLSMVLNILLRGQGVALYSIEMTKKEIAQGLVAMLSGVPKSVLRSAVLTQDQYQRFVKGQETLHQLPLYTFGRETYDLLNPIQHKRSLRSLKVQTPIAITFIDGIWLMEPNQPTQNRWRDVHLITYQLGAIAEKMGIPIVAMQQYKQGYSERLQSSRRKAKRPYETDVAEGSAIVRNAQVLIGLHRPNLYGENAAPSNLLQAFVMKDRNGSYVNQEPVSFSFDRERSMYKEATRIEQSLLGATP